MAAAATLIEKWNRVRIRHQHLHPPLVDLSKLDDQSRTFGERMADGFARTMGSWTFIGIQSLGFAVWVALNIAAWVEHWDPYPFILLNLALSFQAAYAAPIIMMSQNRQATKDRLAAEHDYQVNVKAEEEVKAIMTHLEQQDELMLDILHRLEEQHQNLLSRIADKLPDGAAGQKR
ncbi:MAG TPA: DUF1003 domain-containing protein [Candidatus Binataceae bacterium]|jgi:uncharacterized membrane protein